ncbi:MAG: hemolysin-type calcium-binding region, partial [Elstera sp.]
MAITFNESYYLQTNPDVALAVSLRQFASGADHFNKLGANELRNPNAVFDSKYYAAQNPDVLTAVSAKTYASVYAHYLANGLKEGRAPNASLKGFDGADYLAKNPDVATAGFTAATALQHYVQYGVDENRSFTSSTAGAVTGNVAGTTGDDTITPAGGQANTVRVEGGQQGAAGDTLVITSGSAS